jgi:hypothetical protein
MASPHTCACGRQFETEDELKWHLASDTSRTHQLGALESHDLGLALWPDAPHPFLGYITVSFWRCDKCGAHVETTSVLERKFCLALGVDVEKARFAQDLEAVVKSKATHVCDVSPPGASPVPRKTWEHRCDKTDRLVRLDLEQQCGECGERFRGPA